MQSLKFYIDNPRVFGFSLLDKFGYLFSDKLYLQLLYYFRMGKKLHLKHSTRNYSGLSSMIADRSTPSWWIK